MTNTTTGVDPRTLLALDEFDAQVDAFAGTTVGFAALVRELAQTRAAMAAVRMRRREVFDVLKDHYEAGRRVAPGGVRLRMSQPTEVSTKWAVPAAVVKKHDKRLWAAARTVQRFVKVTPTAYEALVINARADLAVGTLPEVPEPTAGLPKAIAVYQSCPTVAKWALVETQLVDQLQEIGQEYGWDGLPITFRDKWTVGVSRLQYDSDRLREIAPELWQRMAIATQVGGYSRVMIDDGRRVFDDDEDAAE